MCHQILKKAGLIRSVKEGIFGNLAGPRPHTGQDKKLVILGSFYHLDSHMYTTKGEGRLGHPGLGLSYDDFRSSGSMSIHGDPQLFLPFFYSSLVETSRSVSFDTRIRVSERST